MASATIQAPPAHRLIAQGEGWRVHDVVCSLGPHDRAFEEQHGDVTVALVLSGSFFYRSDAGRALLYPGALLLGNAGACFECGHDHATGDHCLSFQFSRSLFAEISGSDHFRFPAGMLPAASRIAGFVIKMEAASRDPVRLEELSIGLAEGIVTTLAGDSRQPSDPSARDRKRIGDAVRHIEESADAPLSLSDLARVARMSRYHFLRTFRQALGVTPYQLLLNVRMRRAASALKATPAPVSAIAYEAGFGDLSTFNARFRSVVGMTPQAFRKA